MRKSLIASAAVLTLSGVAAAQEAPALIYSDAFAQNVLNADGSSPMTVTSERNASLPTASGVGAGQNLIDIQNNENYSGR